MTDTAKPLLKFSIKVTETGEDGTPYETEFIDWFTDSIDAAQTTAEAFSVGAKIEVKPCEPELTRDESLRRLRISSSLRRLSEKRKNAEEDE